MVNEKTKACAEYKAAYEAERIQRNRGKAERTLAHDILKLAMERGLRRVDLENAFDLCKQVLWLQPVRVEDAEIVFHFL